MYSDKKLDTHCQKIRHLRFYVIFYLIENELNKTLARYLNALLRIKENNMNKKNLLRMTICFFSGWMGLEAAAQEIWDVDRCMNYAVAQPYRPAAGTGSRQCKIGSHEGYR